MKTLNIPFDDFISELKVELALGILQWEDTHKVEFIINGINTLVEKYTK